MHLCVNHDQISDGAGARTYFNIDVSPMFEKGDMNDTRKRVLVTSSVFYHNCECSGKNAFFDC